MTRLTAETYLAHLRAESDRFRDALRTADPTAPLPSCPDWTAADLLQHLTGVQAYWAEAILVRPAEPEHRELVRAGTREAMLADSRDATDRLVSRLAAADPAEAAWNWSPDRTVGFLLRRQAHEAAVHRIDAELVAGTATPLDPLLAADGVHEVLDVMYGGTPDWGTFTPDDRHLRVDLTDVDQSVWVALGRFTGRRPGTEEDLDLPDLSVVDDPGTEPAVVVDGPAADVDLWLWRRGDDRGVRVAGDPGVLAAFRALVDQPID